MLYLTIAILLIVISIFCSSRGILLQRQKKDSRRMFNWSMIFFILAIVVYFIPMVFLIFAN